VSNVLFEHLPGRGRPEFTHDRTAFDAITFVLESRTDGNPRAIVTLDFVLGYEGASLCYNSAWYLADVLCEASC
jgi:hypothetical protein